MKLRKPKQRPKLRSNTRRIAELQKTKQWFLLRHLLSEPTNHENIGIGVIMLMRMVPETAREAIEVWANHKPGMFKGFFNLRNR